MEVAMRNALLLSILVLPLALTTARAGEVYKCVAKGEATYQSTPCAGEAPSAPLKLGRASSLPGCYLSAAAGAEHGFEVRRVGSEEFKLVAGDGKSPDLPLRIARVDEMRQLGEVFHLTLQEGLTLDWQKGAAQSRPAGAYRPTTAAESASQKPVGVYRGRDANGREIYFAYFYFAAGLVTPTPCR